jgi:hypothetical protein
MTRKKVLEQGVTKIFNTEVTPQAIWSIAKSLLKKVRSTVLMRHDVAEHQRDLRLKFWTV